MDARSDGTILTVRPGIPARSFGPKVGVGLWGCTLLKFGENPLIYKSYRQFRRHTHQYIEAIPNGGAAKPGASENRTS